MEKLQFQGLLKVECSLAAREKIKETNPTSALGLWSLMKGQLQGLPLQSAALCTA